MWFLFYRVNDGKIKGVFSTYFAYPGSFPYFSSAICFASKMIPDACPVKRMTINKGLQHANANVPYLVVTHNFKFINCHSFG